MDESNHPGIIIHIHHRLKPAENTDRFQTLTVKKATFIRTKFILFFPGSIPAIQYEHGPGQTNSAIFCFGNSFGKRCWHFPISIMNIHEENPVVSANINFTRCQVHPIDFVLLLISVLAYMSPDDFLLYLCIPKWGMTYAPALSGISLRKPADHHSPLPVLVQEIL